MIPSSGAAGTAQALAYRRRSSLAMMSNIATADTPGPNSDTDSPTTSSKKRWTFMSKSLPITLSTPAPGSLLPGQSYKKSPSKALEEVRKETALARSRPGHTSKSPSTDSETPPATATTHRVSSFKFSLEWGQHFDKGQGNGNSNGRGAGLDGINERRLSPPRLPAAAQAWLGAKVPGSSREVAPADPAVGGGNGDNVARAKYAGRALVEWSLIVAECNNFADRRRSEGVPGLKWVEVPMLGVEGFRKFAA